MTALVACAGVSVLGLGIALSARSSLASRVRVRSMLTKLLALVGVAFLLYGAVHR